MTFDIHGAQIVGDRKRQEDAFGVVEKVEKNAALAIVCDGMGGHGGGDVASAIASEAFMEVFQKSRGAPKRCLKQALAAANDRIASEIAENSDLREMGTTLVAAFASGADLHWVSVGDSSLYIVRNGTAERVNEDHSMGPVLDDLAAAGRMSMEEAAADPQRNVLRSAVSGDEIDLIDLQSKSGALEKGDVIILASDGLDTISPDKMAEIVSKAKDAKSCANALLQAVEEAKHPHQDNATVIILAVGEKRKKILGLF
ncbi:MAG: protein phosphatase 2C domain-containing protein [Pseudomonadota bacterium]